MLFYLRGEEKKRHLTLIYIVVFLGWNKKYLNTIFYLYFDLYFALMHVL